jgi:hypothetical protein
MHYTNTRGGAAGPFRVSVCVPVAEAERGTEGYGDRGPALRKTRSPCLLLPLRISVLLLRAGS